MSLKVKPDIEARIVALAQASGVSVEEFLQRMIEEKTGEANVAATSPLSPAERVAVWRESVKSLPHTPPLSDDAVSRESIYSERG